MSLFVGVLSSHVAWAISAPILGVARGILIEENGETQKLPASRWTQSRARRILEGAVAAVALVALIPVLALCWLLVRCSSPGPGLFRQQRMGRNGKTFVLYKFRSMRCGQGKGPSLTVRNDVRITRVGALLRRYKLDELPQFWNVLKGDMSLVGPRPKLPHLEPLHMPYRPGLTGPATLAFRHEEQMLLEIPAGEVDRFYDSVVKPIKAELDLRYMEQATLWTDLGFVVRTMACCLSGTVDPARELSQVLNRHGELALPEEAHGAGMSSGLDGAARVNLGIMERVPQ